MLNNISWHQYILGAILLLLIYYTIIAFLFYRSEIFHLLRNIKPPSIKMGNSEERLAGTSIEELKQVVAELGAILEQARVKKVSKDELLGQLAERLANFDGFRNTAYRIALINYIIRNSEAISGVAISEAELEVALEGPSR